MRSLYVVNLKEDTVKEKSHEWVREKRSEIHTEYGPAFAGNLCETVSDETVFVVFTKADQAWSFLFKVKRDALSDAEERFAQAQFRFDKVRDAYRALFEVKA